MLISSASSYRLMYMLHSNYAKRGVRTSGWIPPVVMLLALLYLGERGYSQGLQSTLEKLPAQTGCEGNPATLNVSSARMTFDSPTRTFIFEEKVRILRCTMVITCDRLQVINDASDKNVDRIIATGNVHFDQGARSGTAERADYFESEQKLVLTGTPRVWDTPEHNELTGEEIVVMLQEEKVFVKQAHVLFHPRQTALTTP